MSYSAWAKSNRKQTGNQTVFAELYPTPTEATKALLSAEFVSNFVWEPASGLGHISRVLERTSRHVYSTDLHADRYNYGKVLDFLTTSPIVRPLPGMADLVDLVTNPPYSKARQFIAKAHELPWVRKVAFFLPFDSLRVQGMARLFKKVGFPRVHVLTPTLVIDHGPGRGFRKSLFNHAWYVWDDATRAKNHLEVVELDYLFWKE